MKTKNIFRMLLVAAALLMGANNVKADEIQIWPASGTSNEWLGDWGNNGVGKKLTFDKDYFSSFNSGDGLKIYVSQGELTGGGTPQIQIYTINWNPIYSSSNVDGSFILINDDKVKEGILIQGYNLYIHSMARIPSGQQQTTTTYKITIANDIQHGTVSVYGGKTTGLAEDETVTLTATPDTGYEFGSWSVKDASNNTVTVTDNQFSMPASDVTVRATFNETSSSSTDDQNVVVWSYSGDGIGQDLGSWGNFKLPDGSLNKLKCDGTDVLRVYGVFGDLAPSGTTTYAIELTPDFAEGNYIKYHGTETFAEGYHDFTITNPNNANFATELKNGAHVNGYNFYVTSIVLNPTTTPAFTYKVTTAATSHGTIEGQTATSYSANSEYTFDVTPATGYEIDDVWIEDAGGNRLSTEETGLSGDNPDEEGAVEYTFAVPAKNVVIHATFKSTQTITLENGENIVWQGEYGPQWFNNGWQEVLYIPTEMFKAASDGDVVRVYGTFNSDDWAVEFKEDTNGWPLISEWVKSDGTKCNQANAGTVSITDLGNGVKYIEFPLTTTFIESIDYDNFVIQGVNFCVDKVVINVNAPYTITYTVNGDHADFAEGNPEEATAGTSVYFSITSVDDGWIANVTATYGNGTALTLTSGGNGLYSFTMPDDNVTVTLSFTEIVTINATIGTYGGITFSCDEPVNIPEGVTAYYATEVSNGRVVLIPITTGIIPRETGVVLLGNEGTYTFTMASSEGTAISGNLLQPVLDQNYYTCESASEYVLTWHDRLVFAQTSTENYAEVAKGQAYLDLSGASAGSRLRLSFMRGDDSTGISDIKAETVGDGAIYDLRGQRVEKPTKGLYIINGKKVVIK